MVIAREKDERLQIFINECNISSAQLEIYMALRKKQSPENVNLTSPHVRSRYDYIIYYYYFI
jgi:hypothetical protein